MTDDFALIAEVRAGKRGAFERLITQHQGLVWHMICRLVPHPEDARELSQDVFMRVHKVLPQFRGESSLSTWIGRIAFSVAARHLRKKRVPMQHFGDDDAEQSMIESVPCEHNVLDQHIETELTQHLYQHIETLSPIQRTLITLYHLDEKSIDEIAYMTELPIGTVKNYLFRARARLRAAMANLLETHHAAVQ